MTNKFGTIRRTARWLLRLTALGGNDFIEGTSGGKDYYFGEAGNDLIQVFDPDSLNDGGEGRRRISGSVMCRM
jgi:hypothetical protein